MTTPPQGPWGPGQQGDQQGQGGWGRQQPQPGQPGPQAPQQGGWGQQPPAQGGWGQQPGQPGGQQPGQQPRQQPGQQPGYGGYSQQPWGQQPGGGQGGWQQQHTQQPWQPGGRPPGGNNKLPLFIGGGVVAVLLVGVLIFFGVRALGDDEPEARPTTQPPTQPTTGQPSGDPSEQPSGEPTAAPSQGIGNATGQAKSATDKLTAAGFQCSDLFNGPQGAHRGCFKYDGSTQAEAVFQFLSDGSVIGVRLSGYDSDNVNNAATVFDTALAAVGSEALGGDLEKVRAAVKSGQKSSEVATGWGELRLSNSGDSLRLSGGKSGTDSMPVPRKQFESTEANIKAGLQGKGYECTTSCRKSVGDYGSQRVYTYGSSDGSGIRTLEVSVSGDPAEVKAAFPTATADAFAVAKSADVAVIQAWMKTHSDGKSHVAYVNGWRVELLVRQSSSAVYQELKINNESYYV